MIRHGGDNGSGASPAPGDVWDETRSVHLSLFNASVKRGIDILGATVGLALTFWLIVLGWVAATLDTRTNGFFVQERVGRHGKHFRIFKLRTMRVAPTLTTTVTTSSDSRITPVGRFLRRTKLDELPQLINVLKGDMSFVGPRPDVPGFADRLKRGDRAILSVRPGITGPATLKYRDEETILANTEDPEAYNSDVIYPDKVIINKEYVANWSLRKDLEYIWRTFVR